MRLAARRQSVLRTSRRDWAPALEARPNTGSHRVSRRHESCMLWLAIVVVLFNWRPVIRLSLGAYATSITMHTHHS